MEFRSLAGLVPYQEARELQLQLVELRAKDEIPDTVLFLEHEPVITRGRGLQWTGVARPRQMPLAELLPSHLSFAESERGGDLTYHGPGQLVIYPICKLDGRGFGPARDIAGYLRKIEKIVIEELGSRGIFAHIEKNAAGVWVGEKKIASLGVAVRKWVTYHGIAINCVNPLDDFYLFFPCGFRAEVMTRLADLIPLENQWRTDLEESFKRRFSLQS